MDTTDLLVWASQPMTMCPHQPLTDIQAIRIPHDAPAKQRLQAYFDQSGNPYLFKSGDLIIQLCFTPGDAHTLPTLENCLAEGLYHNAKEGTE